MTYSNEFGMALHGILTNDVRMNQLRAVHGSEIPREIKLQAITGMVLAYAAIDGLHWLSEREASMLVRMADALLLDEVLNA